jgi:hypothetical protein
MRATQAVGIPCSSVELRHHLVLQQRVERLGVAGVVLGIIGVLMSIAQRPPHVRRIGLRPPTIQHR